MIERTKSKYTLQIGIDDLKKMIAKEVGISVESIQHMEDVKHRREISIGLYDVDYVYTFDGLKVQVEE